jgi:hypothetical protein
VGKEKECRTYDVKRNESSLWVSSESRQLIFAPISERRWLLVAIPKMCGPCTWDSLGENKW